MQVGVVGDVWKMRYKRTSTSWFSTYGIYPEMKAQIHEALIHDAKNCEVTFSDPYFGGKQIAKIARLVLIAEELKDTSIVHSLCAQLKQALHPWLQHRFKYDQSYGGVLCDESLQDKMKDFGAGWYNDHHFQYGYFLYAAAVLGKHDTKWLQENKEKCLNLVLDIANADHQHSYFCTYRHKDWYCGHSWASGLFEAVDGPNQESISEAVNAYYAIYLLGLSLEDKQVQEIGKVLLATEIHAAHVYWQIRSKSDMYPQPLCDNKSIGIMNETRVLYGTWFGNRVEFIHCIQMLPYTPITSELLPVEWLKEEYPVLEKSLEDPTMEEGWRGFVYLTFSMLNARKALGLIRTLKTFDNGNSLTNSLHFVADQLSRQLISSVSAP